MLYKSLHFKLVLMFVLFIIIIISIIAAVMLNRVFDFYTNNFIGMMSQTFNDDTLKDLAGLMDSNENFYVDQRDMLKLEYGNLGITNTRNLYILDMLGNYLIGTNDELGQSLDKTSNMLAAMDKRTGDKQSFGLDYMDYAVYLSGNIPGDSGETTECIIYVKDTQEEMRKFMWTIFAIIIQVLLIGLVVAVFLSFFLAKAITSPIQSITKRALKLAAGDFRRKIEVVSNDEIGTLTVTFNDMADKLKDKMDEVSSEREKLEIMFLYHNDGVLVFSNDGKLDMINPQGREMLKADFGYYGGGKNENENENENENDGEDEDGNGNENNLHYADGDFSFDDFVGLFNLNAEEESEKGEIEDTSAGRVFKNAAYGEKIFDVSIGKFRYARGEESRLNRPDSPNPSEGEGTLVVIHDVTQSYALEKSRREFMANVSHELKTPLTTIINAVETVIDGRVEEEFKARCLNMILSEGERMERIVGDLLVISRLDNKKMMWQFTPVNLGELTKNIYEAMQGEALKNGQTLTLKTGKNIPVIYADKGRIEQVLGNIVSNALKYTPTGGKIEIALSGYKIKSGGGDIIGAKVVVKDNGIGIPEEDIPHIFDRFYRVEKARSTEAGGTGLGLSIANEFVQAHKGTISVDNAPGGGTVVTVILPQNSGGMDDAGDSDKTDKIDKTGNKM